MTLFSWVRTAAVAGAAALPLLADSPAARAEAKPVYAFSALRGVPDAAARTKVEAWLKSGNKFDAAKFAIAWPAGAPATTGLLPAVALGRPAAADLATAAANPGELPAVLKDATLDPFVRSHLAATYARACAKRKAYEESLAAAKLSTPEHLSDPAGYYFYRAVAEHALMQRDPAAVSIARLLDDVQDVPDRYRVVATLLFFDLQSWAKDEKDLANIGRLMDNSGRRLELARGGKETQDIQKKIVFRLDEKIKELEAKAKGQGQGQPGQPGQGQCPSGAPGQGPGSNTPSAPQDDSRGGKNGGDGQVDPKKLRNYEAVWGTLPAAERTKIAQDFVRDMPPKFKPMIEDYFRSLNRLHGFKP